MDPMGGIVMTSDGNAVLREIVVQHPAAKSMIEIAHRAQASRLHAKITTHDARLQHARMELRSH